MAAIGSALPTTSAATAVLAVATLLMLILCTTLKTRIPGAIVALVAGTAAAHLLGLPRRDHRLALPRHPERAGRRFAAPAVPRST